LSLVSQGYGQGILYLEINFFSPMSRRKLTNALPPSSRGP